ncbi:MAG TPA: hypothetical protein VHM90_21575 [Phycisphaerae bacterium]|jgi:hypothetical protein|nr:hypothetical protein [Phycisphaerae bacterium]
MAALFARHFDYPFSAAELLARIDRISQPSPRWYPYSFQRLPAGKTLFINRQSTRIFFHGSSLLTYKARICLEIESTPGGCRAILQPRNFEWLFPLFTGALWFFLLAAWVFFNRQTPQTAVAIIALLGAMFFFFAAMGWMFSRVVSRHVQREMRAISRETKSPSSEGL